LTCLEYHVEDAMELVAEVLENYPNFFEAKHQEMLWSAISGPWGLEILKNADAETVSLARIIVAYGQILLDSKVIFKQPENAHHRQVICKSKLPMRASTVIYQAANSSCSFPTRSPQIP
jgi:hypothetical protein